MRVGILAVVLLGILGAACYGICLEWKGLAGRCRQAGLRYGEGALSGEQIDAFSEKDPSVELAAWKREENKDISLGEGGVSQSGTLLTVYGPMELVVSGEMKYGGYTFQKDRAGCVISAGLARGLFGTDRVVGNAVFQGGTELTVRGVVDWEEPVLVRFQTDRGERMPLVEIRTKDQPPAPRLKQIASSLGLFGEAYIFQGSFYCSVARLLVSLPFWVLYFLWGGRLLWKTRHFNPWLAFLVRGIFLLGIGLGIRLSLSFTPDYIPSKWSDFGFYGGKAQELAGWIRQRRDFPEVYWEGEVLRRVGRIGTWVLVSLGGIWGGKGLWKEGS